MKIRHLKCSVMFVIACVFIGCTTSNPSYEPGPTPVSPTPPPPPPPPRVIVDEAATTAVQGFFQQVLRAYYAENNAYPSELSEIEKKGFGRLPQLPPGREFDYDRQAGSVRVIQVQ